MILNDIRVLNGQILVLDEPVEDRKGMIYLPESRQKEHIIRGVVIKTSDDKTEEGVIIEPEVTTGDKVLYAFTAGAGNALLINNNLYRFVKPIEIIALIQ